MTRAAVRQYVEPVVVDLIRACGVLEEVATVWRRAGLFRQQPSSCSPANLQDAARKLAALLRALPDTDSGERRALVCSAETQLAIIEKDVVHAAAVTTGRRIGDAEMWATIQGLLQRAGEQLRSLSRLGAGDTALTEDASSGMSRQD
jgi:hypothetical protein